MLLIFDCLSVRNGKLGSQKGDEDPNTKVLQELPAMVEDQLLLWLLSFLFSKDWPNGLKQRLTSVTLITGLNRSLIIFFVTVNRLIFNIQTPFSRGI